MKVDFFYGYFFSDYVIRKFVNSFIKDGEKEKFIIFFVRCLFFLKKSFGLNPIFLIKFSILRYNLSYQVIKRKKGRKTFYYTRILDVRQQLNQCVRRFIRVINLLRKKKKLSFWQSFFVTILNHCVQLKNSKSYYFRREGNNFKKKVFREDAIDKVQFKINNLYNSFSLVNNMFYFLKNKTYYFNSLFLRLKTIIFKIISILLKFYEIGIDARYFINSQYSVGLYTYFLNFKSLFFSIIGNSSRILLKLREGFFNRFLKLKNRFYFRKKKILKGLRTSIKMLRRRLLKKNRFFRRFIKKENKEFYSNSKYISSNMNMMPFFRFKTEVNNNIRFHSIYNSMLRHRNLFFRMSKHGRKNS